MLALFFIGKMSLELVSLFKLIRSGEVRYSGRFLLVSLSRKLTPFSFFHYICHTRGEEHLPEFDLILNHEKVHARQLHSLDVIISTVYRAIFWFNPLAWWVKKQITENLEFIADSQAKSTNTSSISYERTLLSVMACQQPALANNFFTPFIKQRIVMLQKETSARWHAYKYALILPIIVLFLYSFNVVEEIKYVEPTSVEDDYVLPTFKDRFYTISKETTDEEISGIVNTINVNENYHMDFINLDRDPDGQLLKMNVRLFFYAEPENVHTFSLGDDEISSERFEVIVSNNRFKVGIPNTPFYYTATKDGLTVMDQDDDSAYSHNDIIGSDPLLVFNGKQLLTSEIPKGTILSCDVVKALKPSEAIKIYGARAKDGAMVYVGKTVITTSTSNQKDNEVLIIKISSKTTQKELDEIVAQISEFDVDFKIKKAKYSGGKLVKFQMKLNDKKGFETSINDNSSDGIKDICITRKSSDNKVDWKVDRCENIALFYTINNAIGNTAVTFKGIDAEEMSSRINEYAAKQGAKSLKSTMNDEQLQQHIAQIQQHIAIISADSVHMATQNMKQHVAQIQQHIATISRDSALYRMKLSQMEMDAVLKDLDLNIYQIQGKAMDSMKTRILLNNRKLDSITNKIQHSLNSSNSIYTLGDVYFDGELIKTGDSLPIYIVNGKELTEADYKRVPKDKVISVNVLKGQKAIDKYGEKGKRGVFDIKVVNGYKLMKPSELTDNIVRGYSYSTNTTDPSTYKSTNYSESVSIEKVVFTDFTREELEKYSEQIEQNGYEFKIRTFRTKGDKVVKLKVDFAGSSYTIVADEEIEKLTFHYFNDGRKPIMTSVSR